MNKHAIRYAMLGRVRFDVHPGTFWPSQVRFGQGAFGRGYVLTRYHFVRRFPSLVAAILKHHLWSHWNSSWPWFRSSVRNPIGPRVLYPLTLNSCNQPIFADNEFMRQSISTILHFENSEYYSKCYHDDVTDAVTSSHHVTATNYSSTQTKHDNKLHVLN